MVAGPADWALLALPFIAAFCFLGNLARWIRRASVAIVRAVRRHPSSRPEPPTEHQPSLSTLLADRPSPIDLLDVAPIVEGLARVLNDPGTALPLSVALTGRWGAGKSSAMLQLERRLSAPSGADRTWIPVWFDAWRFQGRDALWAGIARSIFRDGLAHQDGLRGRLGFRVRLARRRLGWPKIVSSIGLVLVAVVWIAVATIRSGTGSMWETATGIGAAVTGIVGAGTILRELGDPFRRVAGVFGRSASESGPTDRAEHDIDCLISTLTDRGDALVVFLDDLDRCPASVIREALVCVAEVFGRGIGDPVVFVLGVDMDLVVSVVENDLAPVRDALVQVNPERSGLLGRQFVEKIFQLQVSLEATRRLPTERLIGAAPVDGVDPDRLWRFLQELRHLPTDEAAGITIVRNDHGLGTGDVDRSDLAALRAAVRIRRSELLSSSADEVRRAELQVLAALRLTPRAVKRLDNSFRMQLQIATNTPGSELRYEPPDLLALAKWTALRLFFPTITAAATAQIGLWEQLESAAAAGAFDQVRDLRS
ncbi:MAG: P-loop NTPase fold protein [Ilumatobacteraceae bacterium]